MAKQTPKADPSAENTVKRLSVRSAKAGFRRAGRAWPAEETIVDVDEFTAEQIGELLAEPMLTVLPIADE